MILLNFSLGFRKCFQRDYIPSNSSVQTRSRPGISNPTLFVSIGTYLAFILNITIVLALSKIYLK